MFMSSIPLLCLKYLDFGLNAAVVALEAAPQLEAGDGGEGAGVSPAHGLALAALWG